MCFGKLLFIGSQGGRGTWPRNGNSPSHASQYGFSWFPSRTCLLHETFELCEEHCSDALDFFTSLCIPVSRLDCVPQFGPWDNIKWGAWRSWFILLLFPGLYACPFLHWLTPVWDTPISPAIGGHLRPAGPELSTGWLRTIPWVKPGEPQRRTAKFSPAQFPELKEQLFQSTTCYGLFSFHSKKVEYIPQDVHYPLQLYRRNNEVYLQKSFFKKDRENMYF